jgi:hypothetical protein
VEALNFEYFDSIAAIITGAVASVAASRPADPIAEFKQALAPLATTEARAEPATLEPLATTEAGAEPAAGADNPQPDV